MLRVVKFLDRSDSGATAIEYAVIAGLIGLGIVGSLVTTRTSLSSVFGTASSRMDSASSSTGSAATPSVVDWSKKTIASKTTESYNSGRATQTKYTFTDGSTASYTVSKDFTNYPYNPTMELYSGPPGGPKVYEAYRASTAQNPSGVLYYGVENGAGSGAYRYETEVYMTPSGSTSGYLRDFSKNPIVETKFSGPVSSAPYYEQVYGAYQYFGTNP